MTFGILSKNPFIFARITITTLSGIHIFAIVMT